MSQDKMSPEYAKKVIRRLHKLYYKDSTDDVNILNNAELSFKMFACFSELFDFAGITETLQVNMPDDPTASELLGDRRYKAFMKEIEES